MSPAPSRTTTSVEEEIENTEEETPEPATLGISPAQVLGSAAAAVSSALLASRLGVTGTLIGAAVASLMATVGGAVYTYSLRRSSQVILQTTVRQRGADVVVTESARPAGPSRVPWRRLPWRRLVLGAVTVMALALLAITALEMIAGRSVTSITTGTDSGRTTVGRLVDAEPHSPAPERNPAGGSGETTPDETTGTPDQPTPPEPSEPTGPTEPSEPTEPAEPTEPTEPSEPTEPAQPTEPGADPAHSAEPDPAQTEPAQSDPTHSEPTQSDPTQTDPAGPAAPAVAAV